MQDLPTEQVKQGLPAQPVLGLQAQDALEENPEPEKKTNTYTGRKRGRAQNYPADFELFWQAYQSLPSKAGKQSKPLALEAWKAALTHQQPADLQRAVELQLEVQRRELNTQRAFTVTMPDCFRWLRDQCYLALLEGHVAEEAYTPTYTVL
jgi:hypothetical protein